MLGFFIKKWLQHRFKYREFFKSTYFEEDCYRLLLSVNRSDYLSENTTERLFKSNFVQIFIDIISFKGNNFNHFNCLVLFKGCPDNWPPRKIAPWLWVGVWLKLRISFRVGSNKANAPEAILGVGGGQFSSGVVVQELFQRRRNSINLIFVQWATNFLH